MIARMRMIGGVLFAAAVGICLLPAGNAQQTAPAAVPARRAGAVPAASAAPNVAGVTVRQQTANYPSQLEYAPQLATPQMQQLHAEEIDAANEAQAHVSAFAKASESERETLKTAIRDALVRQFDAQQKRRSEEITSIEERLGKLKETLQKRDAAKDAIVGKRLDQLTGAKDDLAWEETRTASPTAVIRFPTTNRNWPATPYAPSVEPPAGSFRVPPTLNLPITPVVPAPPVAPVPAVPSVQPPPPPAPPSPARVPAPAAPPATTAAPASATPVPPPATTPPQ